MIQGGKTRVSASVYAVLMPNLWCSDDLQSPNEHFSIGKPNRHKLKIKFNSIGIRSYDNDPWIIWDKNKELTTEGKIEETFGEAENSVKIDTDNPTSSDNAPTDSDKNSLSSYEEQTDSDKNAESEENQNEDGEQN